MSEDLLPERMLPPPDKMLLSESHLIVWMNYATTLALLDQVGMLDRELAIYQRLRPHVDRISIITWSKGEDTTYVDRLGDIRLVHNPLQWTWPAWMALMLASFGMRFPRRRVVKTNQMSGAQHILRVARAWQTPLIARCGYPWSLFAEREKGPDNSETRLAIKTERAVFKGAVHVVGSTMEIASLAMNRYGVPADRVSVIPNYVDTDLMSPPARPRTEGGAPFHIGFLGRLERQKNPLAMIEALADLPVRLSVVGNGSLRGEMEALAKRLGIDVAFLGNVKHAELPTFFRSLDLFLLPSLFEGHPKALLEAMSCGVPVVATEVAGTRQVVFHERTGLLCGTDAASLRSAIQRAITDREGAARWGAAAREEIVNTVSLDLTVDREMRVLSRALKAN